MTDKELMSLVNRYAEACVAVTCYDIRANLLEKSEIQLKADEAYGQIQSEVQRLHTELAKAMRIRIEFGDIISNHCVAMQAAVIDEIQSPGDGIAWIENTLIGPGLYPDIDAALAIPRADPKSVAQAWFDAKTAEHEAFRKAHPGPEALAATVGEIVKKAG